MLGLQNIRDRLKTILAISVIFALFSCISTRPPGVGKNSESGVASWYGKDFHGRPTASGEIYDMYKMTAAHKYCPLGTWAEVRNLDTGRKVTVKINDRGPFVRGRIIDLSYAAAKKIDMLGTGTARVVVNFMGSYNPSQPVTNAKFFVQVGSFLDRGNAENLKSDLAGEFPLAGVYEAKVRNDKFYRVCIGPITDDDNVQSSKERLESKDLKPFVTSGTCGF
jgi:rare lipoprotein A